jgi:putative transposase
MAEPAPGQCLSGDLIDAMVVKIRDGLVANRPVYCAVGVTGDGERDILGLWVGIGCEGAKYWQQVLNEIMATVEQIG